VRRAIAFFAISTAFWVSRMSGVPTTFDGASASLGSGSLACAAGFRSVSACAP
jgi:hypothetical protein